MMFAHVANGPLWGTGLALTNSSTITAANVQVFVMRQDGSLVGSNTFTIPAGGESARLISDLVPAAIYDDGFVFVRSTNLVSLYGVELFFSRDQRVLANIPGAAIDSAITYNPPAATPPLQVTGGNDGN